MGVVDATSALWKASQILDAGSLVVPRVCVLERNFHVSMSPSQPKLPYRLLCGRYRHGFCDLSRQKTTPSHPCLTVLACSSVSQAHVGLLESDESEHRPFKEYSVAPFLLSICPTVWLQRRRLRDVGLLDSFEKCVSLF
jgi:hypothetical protein